MENELIIIEYVLRKLNTIKAQEMEIELSMLLKLLKTLPSYDWDNVIRTVCEEEPTC